MDYYSETDLLACIGDEYPELVAGLLDMQELIDRVEDMR